jgi:DNA repair photolyase
MFLRFLKLQALPNVYASFSLSPEKTASQIDEKTPKLAARVLAMKKLQSGGHQLAIHFDPIIYSEKLFARIPGAYRFTGCLD